MNVLVLDGSPVGDPMAARLVAALRWHCPDAEVLTVREQKIGNCAGDFFCWVRSPGMCNVDDDNRVIASKVARCDLVVYLTPVRFGGYSSQLKRIVNHLIQNVSPFFARIDGEVHHRRRYPSSPDLLAIGWQAEPDAAAEAIFRNLVARNAINLYAATAVCGVLTGEPNDRELESATLGWLQAVGHARNSPVPPLSPVCPDPSPPSGHIGRAALLVGSPRTRSSTSYSLGSYLMGRLAACGVHTDTVQVYTSMGSAARRTAALELLDTADLVVLAAPLYVDSLPAPVIAALEQIVARHPTAAASDVDRPRQRFAAVLNCGFPEASHLDTAMAICAQYARQLGVPFLGGLRLGAGQGLIGGKPLEDLGGRAAHVRQALDLAAATLAEGQPIPQEAVNRLARPVIPTRLYTLMGGYGWRQLAHRYGARAHLSDRPYEGAEYHRPAARTHR